MAENIRSRIDKLAEEIEPEMLKMEWDVGWVEGRKHTKELRERVEKSIAGAFDDYEKKRAIEIESLVKSNIAAVLADIKLSPFEYSSHTHRFYLDTEFDFPVQIFFTAKDIANTIRELGRPDVLDGRSAARDAIAALRAALDEVEREIEGYGKKGASRA